MANLAGMNLALSRLDGPKCPPIDIDTFYVDTVDGIKTVAFLQEFYNKCVKEQREKAAEKKPTRKRSQKKSGT